MRATITVYGEQGSGKSDWLGQLKRALMGTAPIEAVEVTAFETHREPGTSRHVSEQFDEFTIPAWDAEGSVGVARDRETWSVKPLTGGWTEVLEGPNGRATFRNISDAMLFTSIKTLTPVARRAVGAILRSEEIRFDGNRIVAANEPCENPKGDGGEIAEGAGAIPAGVYWHDTAGNFFDALTDRSKGGVFYLFWARRKAAFPTSRAAALRDCAPAFRPSSTAKLSAAEAPAIHDGWPTPMVPRAQRDELAAKVQALEAKLAAVVSHATGGGTADLTLPLNDICVRITKHLNKVYAAGQRRAAMEALREIADMAGVILPKTLADVTSVHEAA